MTPSCNCPILCLLLSRPGVHQWNYTGLWSYSLSTEPLFSLQRSLSVHVKIKTVVDWLTASARGWGWGKEKMGTLQPPSCIPCTLLHACFAHRLIDLKKNLCTGNIVLHVFVNSQGCLSSKLTTFCVLITLCVPEVIIKLEAMERRSVRPRYHSLKFLDHNQ